VPAAVTAAAVKCHRLCGVALSNPKPSRNHMHTVGNDYEMDLLRQHHARYEHVNGAHIARKR